MINMMPDIAANAVDAINIAIGIDDITEINAKMSHSINDSTISPNMTTIIGRINLYMFLIDRLNIFLIAGFIFCSSEYDMNMN